MRATEIINKLNLQPHPEGGYYREIYRSRDTMTTGSGSTRNVCTTIYFLLENRDKSHFHRIRSDEIWYFHQGETLEIIVITSGQLQYHLLGNNIAAGEELQVIIPAQTWFATRIRSSSGFSLVSCSVAPGFDFADFELASQAALSREYPELGKIIEELAL